MKVNYFQHLLSPNFQRAKLNLKSSFLFEESIRTCRCFELSRYLIESIIYRSSQFTLKPNCSVLSLLLFCSAALRCAALRSSFVFPFCSGFLSYLVTDCAAVRRGEKTRINFAFRFYTFQYLGQTDVDSCICKRAFFEHLFNHSRTDFLIKAESTNDLYCPFSFSTRYV